MIRSVWKRLALERRQEMMMMITRRKRSTLLPAIPHISTSRGYPSRQLSKQSLLHHHQHYHSSRILLLAETSAESTTTKNMNSPDDNSSTTTTPVQQQQYSTPELTHDAAQHKAGLEDPSRPHWQNPLHHYSTDTRTYREDFDSQEEFEAAVLPAPPLRVSDDIPPTPADLEELANEMVQLTVLEMNELINKMADHYGFHEGMLSPEDDNCSVGVDDDDDDGNDDESSTAQEAKTAFDVKLMSFDAKSKIKVIKEVRAVAGLGLKEAKELVESAPAVIQKDLKPEQADELKAKLEELGATVEVV